MLTVCFRFTVPPFTGFSLSPAVLAAAPTDTDGLSLTIGRFAVYLLIMAGVTYLIRMLPFTLFRRTIRSAFVRSFLCYIPYAVLGAMTFPAVFYATGDLPSALAGTAVAVLLGFFHRSLLTVALGASGTALAVKLLLLALA